MKSEPYDLSYEPVSLGEVLQAELPGVTVVYRRLLEQLHGPGTEPSKDWIQSLRRQHHSHTLVLLLARREKGELGQRVVATARAHYVPGPERAEFLIHDVVVDLASRGQGVGYVLWQYLEGELRRRWRSNSSIRLLLTNSPRRGNSEFYRALGFRSRTWEEGDPTVVWIKDLPR